MSEEKQLFRITKENLNTVKNKIFLRQKMYAIANKYNIGLNYNDDITFENKSKLRDDYDRRDYLTSSDSPKLKLNRTVITLGRFDNMEFELISFFHELSKVKYSPKMLDDVSTMFDVGDTRSQFETHVYIVKTALELAYRELSINFSYNAVMWLFNKLITFNYQMKTFSMLVPTSLVKDDTSEESISLDDTKEYLKSRFDALLQ